MSKGLAEAHSVEGSVGKRRRRRCVSVRGWDWNEGKTAL